MIACTMASAVIKPRKPSPVSHMSLACSGWYLPDMLQPFCLALDATGGKTCNDAVLENEHHDNQRDGHQRSCCHGCGIGDRKSTRLNSSHVAISYAVFCWNKQKGGT